MNPFLNISKIDMVFPTPKGDFTALKNVDLQIDKGEFISLIGHSGCGKSTFLRHLACQFFSLGGTVIVIEPHGDLILDEEEGILQRQL